MNRTQFKDWMKFRRKRLRLTQQKAAELLGVGRVQLWRWEKGRAKPDDRDGVNMLRIISEKYKCDYAHLLLLMHDTVAMPMDHPLGVKK